MVLILNLLMILVVKMLHDGTKIQIDQSVLETVIPKPGGEVVIVKGHRKSEHGILESIDVNHYCVYVALFSNPDAPTRFEYEEICKYKTS